MGQSKLVNFFTDAALAQTNAQALADDLVEGLHIIDFTAMLDDQTDASIGTATDTTSAVRVATTDIVDNSAAIGLVSNGVIIVNDFNDTATESWSGLTASELQTALNNSANVAGADYANIGSHTGIAPVADAVGTSVDSILMIENDLNAGEYKVFNVETSDLADTDTVAVTLIGTIDFGVRLMLLQPLLNKTFKVAILKANY